MLIKNWSNLFFVMKVYIIWNIIILFEGGKMYLFRLLKLCFIKVEK